MAEQRLNKWYCNCNHYWHRHPQQSSTYIDWMELFHATVKPSDMLKILKCGHSFEPQPTTSGPSVFDPLHLRIGFRNIHRKTKYLFGWLFKEILDFLWFSYGFPPSFPSFLLDLDDPCHLSPGKTGLHQVSRHCRLWGRSHRGSAATEDRCREMVPCPGWDGSNIIKR